MVAFKLQRLSGGGSENKKDHRLKGDPRLLGILSFPDGNYLVATPQGYDSVKLQFLVPSVFLGYTRIAVVRSNYGFPVNKHDGVTVFEYPNTATPVTQTFIDSNFGMGLVQGQWYYYTLFAKMPNSIPNWNQVDVDEAVCTQDYGSGDMLWSKIPGFYQQEDANTLQRQLTYTSGGQLRRFVDLLGYELDIIHTELDTLFDVNSPKDMSSTLLTLQGYDLSLPDEGAIGDARFRSLVDNALSIRETKGTAAGLTEYVRALTDYDVRVRGIHNYGLSSVDTRGQDPTNTTHPGSDPTIPPSLFPHGGMYAGNFVAFLFSTAPAPYTGWYPWSIDSIPPPSTNGYDVVDWMFRLEVGQVSNNNIGFSHLSTTIGTINTTTGAATSPSDVLGLFPGPGVSQGYPWAIPQTGIPYTYSFLATGTGTIGGAGGFQVKFVWYDINGNYISNDAHAVVGTPATIPATPVPITATSNAAPSNAVFVDPQLYFPNQTATFLLDTSGFQLEKGSTYSGVYRDPHWIDVDVIAQRVNLIQNPSAEVDSTLWTGTNMTSLLGAANAAATAGNKVFQITCSASANPTMTTNTFMPINPAYIQSARFDALVPNASIGANCIITWYDGAATPALIRTDTLNFPAPLTVNGMRTYVFGNLVPPATAVNAKMAIQFTGTANGNVVLVDSVLFGPGPPMFYFDGDTQDGLDTPGSVTPTQFSDFQWGGTQGKSTSYYYNNFYIAMKRLNSDVQNWLPSGTSVSFTTLVAP